MARPCDSVAACTKLSHSEHALLPNIVVGCETAILPVGQHACSLLNTERQYSLTDPDPQVNFDGAVRILCSIHSVNPCRPLVDAIKRPSQSGQNHPIVELVE